MPNTLAIQYTPWLEWLVGGLFIAGGLWPALSGEPLFGGGFMLAGALIVTLFANTVTSRFDLAAGLLTQSTKGLLRNKEVTHRLDEISGVRVVQGHGSADSPSRPYTVVVVLRSGGRLQIPSATTGGKTQKERLAAEIRRVLGLPEMPEVTIPGFRDLVELVRDPKPSPRRDPQ